MSRLIDADALYEKFKDGKSDTEQEKDSNRLGRYLIRHAPTIDAAPVVCGRWGHDVLDLSLCSCCLESFKTKAIKGFQFCPSCGAKMDKEEPV